MLGLLDLPFEKHGLMLNCYIYTDGDASKNIKDMGNVDIGIILLAGYEVRGTKILVPFFKYGSKWLNIRDTSADGDLSPLSHLIYFRFCCAIDVNVDCYWI